MLINRPGLSWALWCALYNDWRVALMATLDEALHNTKCDVLRGRLQEFCSAIRLNLIPTFFCPVCGVDLRSSLQPQSNQQKYPGQYTCNVCNLGVQMHHKVEHEGHIDTETGALCELAITMPVSLVNKMLMDRLRTKWQQMRFPRRPLGVSERNKWFTEVQNVLRGFKVQ
jgi:transcription elongation factor Elf1